jgi:hypothetical protein
MNGIDLNQASALLLGIAGGLLQFLMRQFKNVSDIWYQTVAVALTLGCFWLVVRDWPLKDPRDSAIVLILWVSGHLLAVWGGTFGVSSASKAAAAKAEAAGKSVANNLLLPLTDSK